MKTTTALCGLLVAAVASLIPYTFAEPSPPAPPGELEQAIQAEPVAQSGIDGPYQVSLVDDDWSTLEDLTLPMFDPAQGTLKEARYTLLGTPTREYKYENLNSNFGARDVKVELGGGWRILQVLIGIPVGVSYDLTIDAEIALQNQISLGSFGPYDGTTDFAGTSGGTQTETFALNQTVFSVTNASTLAAVTGTGDYDLLATYTNSYQSPSPCGSCTSQVTSTIPGGGVEVTYFFIP